MIRRLVAATSFGALALLGACGGGSDDVDAATSEAAVTSGGRGPSPPAPSCDHPNGADCSFYRSCLDATHPCGDDGYALAYGERFCNAFITHREAFSSAGQRWLAGVRSCLQRELVPLLHEPATCAAVQDKAYATHPGCYTAGDNGVCQLPIADLVELGRLLGDDLYTARALAQIRDVARTCLLDFFGVEPAVAAASPRHRFLMGLEAASASDAAMRELVARQTSK
jgi:hypothetical protein